MPISNWLKFCDWKKKKTTERNHHFKYLATVAPLEGSGGGEESFRDGGWNPHHLPQIFLPPRLSSVKCSETVLAGETHLSLIQFSCFCSFMTKWTISVRGKLHFLVDDKWMDRWKSTPSLLGTVPSRASLCKSYFKAWHFGGKIHPGFLDAVELAEVSETIDLRPDSGLCYITQQYFETYFCPQNWVFLLNNKGRIVNSETLKVTVWLLNYLWLKQTFRATWWEISQEKTSWAVGTGRKLSWD